MRQTVGVFLEKLIKQSILNSTHSVLCICAWEAEILLFKKLGINNVVSSNIAATEPAKAVARKGYEYQYESFDAMNLPYEDESYDFVFVSDGLHHCSVPHKALAEMYRVCKKGIIVCEACDNILIRLAIKYNLIEEYEVSAIVPETQSGGINNSVIPNYVYRWTEREFIKIINSCYPYGKNTFKFDYYLNYPKSYQQNKLLYWPLCLVSFVFKKLRNSFYMVAIKPDVPSGLWKWICFNNGKFGFVETDYKIRDYS